MTAPALELRSITKRFAKVVANDRISLTLQRGEIHALLGENGAGKTTLMNILFGLYQADEGEIVVCGRRLDIRSPADAIGVGIGMVHQHFMLIPVFTVTENVMLGKEAIRSGGFLNETKVAEEIRQISRQYSLDCDPGSLVKDLSVGVQQRVEIIKLLYRQAEILILDEPTSVLTPQEVTELFNIMRNLTRTGKSIVFITHKLGEVLEIADRITVIRQGRVVGTVRPVETTERQLAAMMVGYDVQLDLDRAPCSAGGPILDVVDLVVEDDRGHVVVDGPTFRLHAGEILGIAGVQGNGQTELVQAITGLRQPAGGSVVLMGHDVTRARPRRIRELGLAHIPENRQRDGLVMPFSVMDNTILNNHYLPPYASGQVIRWEAVLSQTEKLIERFDIRTPRPQSPVASLSGGNQQKVVVARELSWPIRLLVAAQPTRGLDVGSIEYIRRLLLEKRGDGVGILLVSTELEEILQLSDRIAVMYRGRLTGILESQEASREQLGLLMAGMSCGMAISRSSDDLHQPVTN
jgi:simple sugar transport system ATP-binding protein